MDAEKIVKSSQEQAVGAWINYLNQVRLDRMIEALKKQSLNLAEAMKSIEDAFDTIQADIVGRNRGGDKGMHGFIAEIAQCGIGNAREQIMGKSAIYTRIDDNGPHDLIRGTEFIQQKFVQSGGHLSLNAVAKHLRQYPVYRQEGYKYQIPKDHYDKIMAYLEIPADTASKLPTATGEFSLRQWKEVHAFFEENSIDPGKLEPSILGYDDVQRGNIAETFEREKGNLREIDHEQRNMACEQGKPAWAEGMRATAAAAAVEGTTTLVMAIAKKRRAGKRIQEFDRTDWMEIAGESGKGTIKGGIRGASIYGLTNFTATPVAVASAMTTAAFGVAEQAHLLRIGSISEVQFIENAEMLCLETSVSALSSFAGQVLIPFPVIGAIIGNAIGMMMYQIGKDSFSYQENELIEQYLTELSTLDKQLAAEYHQHVEDMNRHFERYMALLMAAFDPDVEKALDGSVALAKRMGVADDEILDSYEKIADYFMS